MDSSFDSKYMCPIQTIRNDYEAAIFVARIFGTNTDEIKKENEKVKCPDAWRTPQELINAPVSLTGSPEAWLYHVLTIIPFPFTIVIEKYHIDRVYRDSYYLYFSNQHFETNRFCRRLSFFSGIINEEMFFSEDGRSELKRRFLGSSVVKPHHDGAIGRTLFDPHVFLNHSTNTSSGSYQRLSEFTINVKGVPLSVISFPYSMQDKDTISCAEVTLLNILEYYANNYPDYRFLYPNDILNTINERSPQRVLPVKGISYAQLSTILKQARFSPRLYVSDMVERVNISLKRLWHYYIESGIPVALAMGNAGKDDQKKATIGHSIVGIGHSKNKRDISDVEKRCEKGLSFFDTADMYDEYVIMDDNQLPFSVRNFNDLSVYNLRPSALAVPLAKRMFLDASNAFKVAFDIIADEEIGIKRFLSNNIGSYFNPVVLRLFMTSARSYRRHKINCKDIPISAKKIYSILPLPRFVWVMEIYSSKSYNEGKIIGEIVLDATASGRHGMNCAVIIQYEKFFYSRMPHQEFHDMINGMKKRFHFQEWSPFSGFNGNLTPISHDS